MSDGRSTSPRWLSWGNESVCIISAVSIATGCDQWALSKGVNWLPGLNNTSDCPSLNHWCCRHQVWCSVDAVWLKSAPLCVLKMQKPVCVGEGILPKGDVHPFRNTLEGKLRLSFGARDATLCHVLVMVNFIFHIYMDSDLKEFHPVISCLMRLKIIILLN